MAVLFRGNLRWVILLVGVAGLLTAPSLGVRKCRCYAYPDWAGIFLYTGEDGSVECRSVYSEFAAWWPLLSPPEEYAEGHLVVDGSRGSAGIQRRTVAALCPNRNFFASSSTRSM